MQIRMSRGHNAANVGEIDAGENVSSGEVEDVCAGPCWGSGSARWEEKTGIGNCLTSGLK